MKKESHVHLQNKIVIFRCIDERINRAIETLVERFREEGREVLVIPSAGGGVNIEIDRKYFSRQINTFIARGYTGFVFTLHDDCRHVQVNEMKGNHRTESRFLSETLCHGVEELCEEFHGIAFEGWRIHTKMVDEGERALTRSI